MRESARPDLWEPRPGNRSGPPDRYGAMPGARLCCCAVGAAGAHFTPKRGLVARARGEAAAQQCRRASGRVTERYFWG